MSFTFYPIAGTEPSMPSGVNQFFYSEYHNKTFFVGNTITLGYVALFSIDPVSLVITQEATTPVTATVSSGLTEDPTNGDIFFVVKSSANSTGALYKWVGGTGFTSIYSFSSTVRPEALHYIDGFLYYLGANATIYRIATTGGTPVSMGAIPTAAIAGGLVSKLIRIGDNGKYYLYGAKAVFESSDLTNWVQTHVPNPYTGSQTTWFVTTGFNFDGRHVCLVRYDTSSSPKVAIYELKADGVYEPLCPPFAGDCQGWGNIEGYIFITSSYTSSPNQSLFSVISKNGHVFINKPCSVRFGTSPTTPFVKLGNRVLWPHSTAFAISDPISWIDSMKTKAGWVMGG